MLLVHGCPVLLPFFLVVQTHTSMVWFVMRKGWVTQENLLKPTSRQGEVTAAIGIQDFEKGGVGAATDTVGLPVLHLPTPYSIPQDQQAGTF